MFLKDQKNFFLYNGYCIFESYISKERLTVIESAIENLVLDEGEEAGSEGSDHKNRVRRLCNLFTKGQVFEEVGIEPLSLEFTKLVIGNEIYWQAMNFHDPIPGKQEAHQSIHTDRSFFPNSEAYINVCWVIDEMTYENGATRIVPGSHRGPWPKDVLKENESYGVIENEIYAECPAGSLIFIHGDTWHGGRANYSDSTRRVIHVGYGCSKTPPQQDISSTISREAKNRLCKYISLIPKPLKSFGLENNWISKKIFK